MKNCKPISTPVDCGIKIIQEMIVDARWIQHCLKA